MGQSGQCYSDHTPKKIRQDPEIHSIIGAGAGGEGDSAMNAANILKTLSSGKRKDFVSCRERIR